MQVEALDNLTFHVTSESRKGLTHLVDLVESECSCEYHQMTQGHPICKHITAAESYLMKAMLDNVRGEQRASRKTSGWKPSIKPMSDKRVEENKEYERRKKVWFKHFPYCQWSGGKADDLHHSRGRAGNLLVDMRYWVSVSRRTHEYIHKNPAWAKEHGLIESWNQAGPEEIHRCRICTNPTQTSDMIKGMCINCAEVN